MYVLNAIVPVFTVIALGFVLRRAGFVSPSLASGLSKIAYWVALPALLFGKLAVAFGSATGFGGAFTIVIAGVAGCAIAGYLAGRALHMTGRETGTLVQAAFRGNLGYVGLAVIFSAFPADGPQSAQAIAMLVLAPIVPIHNALAVIALLAGRNKLNRRTLARMAGQVAINPLLLSCVAGVLWSLAGPPLPVVAGQTLSAVGQLALPAALLAIGASLADAKLSGKILHSSIGAIIKIGLAPVIGYLTARAIGAGATETAVGLIFLACPTAVASYILADQLDGDTALASGAVVVSTAGSIISLGIVLGLVM